MLRTNSPAGIRARPVFQLALLACLVIFAALTGAFAQSQPPAGKSQKIAAGERLRISIVGLMGEGVESRFTRRVEAGGALRLPQLDASRLDATALTAAELESAIARLYEQQTTLAVKLVVVSRLDAGEEHALDGWREPPAAERYGGFVVRGLVAPWPAVLSEPLGAATELHEVPLQDVLKTFQQRTKLPVSVDWKVLEYYGVVRNSPVSVSIPPEISVGRALQMVMDATSRPDRMSYDWVEGVLTISEPDDDQRTQTMIVSVAPLLDDRRDDTREAREVQVERIVDVIVESVASDVWQTNGGASGSVSILEDRLVITAPPWVLREVLELLPKLAR